jgi:hypothetical protein
VHGLEKAYAGRIEFVRVNILDKGSEPLMKLFGFSTTPELYLVGGDGKILGFWDDFVEADVLRQAFDRALAGETVSSQRDRRSRAAARYPSRRSPQP